MNTLTTRKPSKPGTLGYVAILLMSASPAFAATAADDAQAQAQALLSGATGARADRVLPVLPAADAGSATDAAEQARALLFSVPASARAQDRPQKFESTASGRSPASRDERSANAGALESARRMILGRGA